MRILLTIIFLVSFHIFIIGFSSFIMWENFFVCGISEWDSVARFIYTVIMLIGGGAVYDVLGD